MLHIALGVILFIKKTQFDTDECCADLCLSLSPMPLPSQILVAGLAPEGKHSPPVAMKAGKLSLISQIAQKKVEKKAKGGRQQHGKGSSREPPAPGQGPPLELSKRCSPAARGPAAAEMECDAPDLS